MLKYERILCTVEGGVGGWRLSSKMSRMLNGTYRFTTEILWVRSPITAVKAQ